MAWNIPATNMFDQRCFPHADARRAFGGEIPEFRWGRGTMVPRNRRRRGPSEDTSAFILEKYLEEFIVSNFHAIFKKRS